MDLDKLHDPFPESAIHWRVGATTKAKDKGIALAYLDARNVMERLDDVCGIGSWQTKYPFPSCCELSIKINGEWIVKSNGAGQTNVEGEKGQFSDAFKRAAVLWGVGQYLYAMPNDWFPIQQRGNSYAFTKEAYPLMSKAYKNFLPLIHRFKAGEKDAIYQSVRTCLDIGDESGLKQVLDEYNGEEEKMKVWALFNSTERSCIKSLLNDAP